MRLDFWFSVGSTYSYLTIMRIGDAAARAGVEIDWHPFSVRAIMREMDNIPFATRPVKARYMWRDIARRAAGYGLSPVVPAPYPLAGFDLANRVAVVGRDEGWCADYARATYRRWFEAGQEAGSEPNLSASLSEIGQDPARVLEQARSDATAAAYDAATDAARGHGIFGVPSFVVEGELFWGDDRLEDALAWAAGRD